MIIDCIQAPMEQYHQKMKGLIGDWKPLVRVSERLLAGEEVRDEEFSPALLPIVELMRVIMQVTEKAEWDWSDPAIQEVFKNLSESHFYKLYAETAAGIVSSIIKCTKIGTLLEIGTGPGQVTELLCRQMTDGGFAVPLFISDRSPTITQTADNLRRSFPHLIIRDYVWDFREPPPDELVDGIKKPVLLFERFCTPYGGYGAIHSIAPIADILIMVEDLNLTGRKEAYDVIMEKIGSQFFVFSEAG